MLLASNQASGSLKMLLYCQSLPVGHGSTPCEPATAELDAATLAILDKGRKNVELLKQPQYSPMPVEKQIAIIFCGTNGLLSKVPENKVLEFEKQFLDMMEVKHKDVLEQLKADGVIISGFTSSTDPDGRLIVKLNMKAAHSKYSDNLLHLLLELDGVEIESIE